MDRRSFLLGLIAVPAIAVAGIPACCPVCGGKLVTVGSMTDTPELPSRNIDVWNRSYHGDPSFPYTDDSPICSRCYFVYSDFLYRWSKSSELSDAFFIPLSNGISAFPLPPKRQITSLVVYSQQFKGMAADGVRTDEVALWMQDDEAYFTQVRLFARTHDLALNFYTADSQPNQSSLTVSASVARSPIAPPSCEAARSKLG